MLILVVFAFPDLEVMALVANTTKNRKMPVKRMRLMSVAMARHQSTLAASARITQTASTFLVGQTSTMILAVGMTKTSR